MNLSLFNCFGIKILRTYMHARSSFSYRIIHVCVCLCNFSVLHHRRCRCCSHSFAIIYVKSDAKNLMRTLIKFSELIRIFWRYTRREREKNDCGWVAEKKFQFHDIACVTHNKHLNNNFSLSVMCSGGDEERRTSKGRNNSSISCIFVWLLCTNSRSSSKAFTSFTLLFSLLYLSVCVC